MIQPVWHFCLVSEQPLANALPALALQPQVRGVVLAKTSAMHQRAQWLSEVLQSRGLEVEFVELPPPQDIPAIRQCLSQWLDTRGGRHVLLNATGGTKTLALVAMQAFAARELPARYLDEANGMWIDLLDHTPPYPLPNVAMRIDEVAAMHGLRVRERQDQPRWPQWIDITRMLGSQIGKRLTDLAALKRALSAAQTNGRPDFGVPPALCAPFESAGIIRRQRNQWCLDSSATQSYVTGGWLEDYALDCAQRGLRQDRLVQDITSGVKVEEVGARDTNGQRPDNELDLLILRNGRLYAMECKTSAPNRQPKVTNVADVLYKLAFQRRIGGHSTRLALLHMGEITGPTQERARMANITLWGVNDMPRLHERLGHWVAGNGAAG